MTHVDQTLLYINQFGSITPLDAMREHGNFRLAVSIGHLRRKGYPIVTVIEHGQNRFGEDVKYARYKFADADV